jgi:hypothetical protein
MTYSTGKAQSERDLLRRFASAPAPRLLLLGLLMFLATSAGRADIISFEKDIAEVGDVRNNSQGICAAAANINSFAFLWNHYPGVYGDTQLLPDENEDGIISSDELDTALDMMAFGWESPFGVTRPGIYDLNPNTNKASGGTARRIWENTYWWFQDFAPGTTVFDGLAYTSTSPRYWVGGDVLAHGYPTWDFLWDSLRNMVDIELGILEIDGELGHALTLTGMEFEDVDGDGGWSDGDTPLKIGFVDPNSPTSQIWADINENSEVRLKFDWWQSGTEFYIYRAYTEGPICLQGDANYDGVVDELDAQQMALHWGMNHATWAMGDFDGDDIVGITDAAILAANWGQTRADSDFEAGLAPIAIPEPSSCILLASLFCVSILTRWPNKERS